jgi:hypothetical protein
MAWKQAISQRTNLHPRIGIGGQTAQLVKDAQVRSHPSSIIADGIMMVFRLVTDCRRKKHPGAWGETLMKMDSQNKESFITHKNSTKSKTKHRR